MCYTENTSCVWLTESREDIKMKDYLVAIEHKHINYIEDHCLETERLEVIFLPLCVGTPVGVRGFMIGEITRIVSHEDDIVAYVGEEMFSTKQVLCKRLEKTIMSCGDENTHIDELSISIRQRCEE